MKSYLGLTFLCAILLTLQSCEQETLDQELTDYCECINTAKNDKKIEECKEQLQEIADKYAYDPEASEEIKKRLQDCVSN